MKRWAEDFAACLIDSNTSQALTMLRCGFPPTTQLRGGVTGEPTNARTYCGHIAAQKGLVPVLRQLVETQGVLELRDSAGLTPFLVACKYAEFEAIRFLARTASVDTSVVDTNGNNGIHLAAANGHKEIVEYLVDELKLSPCVRNNDGEVPADLCTKAVLSADSHMQGVFEAISVYLKSKYSAASLVIDTSPKPKKLSLRSRVSLTPIGRSSASSGPLRLNLRSATPVDRLIKDRCKLVFTTVQNKRALPLRRGATGNDKLTPSVGLTSLFSVQS